MYKEKISLDLEENKRNWGCNWDAENNNTLKVDEQLSVCFRLAEVVRPSQINTDPTGNWYGLA
jgi:hypothetical protein